MREAESQSKGAVSLRNFVMSVPVTRRCIPREFPSPRKITVGRYPPLFFISARKEAAEKHIRLDPRVCRIPAIKYPLTRNSDSVYAARRISVGALCVQSFVSDVRAEAPF